MDKNIINLHKTTENSVMRLLNITKNELKQILSSNNYEETLNEILSKDKSNKFTLKYNKYRR